MASFDIVCEIDTQEVSNAVDQARREIKNRYDFKGSSCEIDFDKTKSVLMITADDEMKMQITIDIMLTKLIKRSVPVKSLVYGKTEPSGRVQKKEITVQQGLNKEQCKKINQFIKSSKIKVQPQTQSDSVRVSSKKKDELQAVMQAIKKHEFDFDVQFANFR